MSLHLLAFDSASSTTKWTQINALVDVVTQSNNSYLLNNDMKLYAAYSLGTNLTNARVNTPTLRQTVIPTLNNIMSGSTVTDPPKVQVWDFAHPLTLKAGELIECDSYVSSGTAHTPVCLIIGDSITPIPQGPVYTLTGSSTTTATASAWTTLTITWDNTLPVGNYSLVGLKVVNASGYACRAWPPGAGYHAGGLCVTANTAATHPIFQGGRLGSWFVFNSYTLFSVEVACLAGDTSHTIYADIIKIS